MRLSLLSVWLSTSSAFSSSSSPPFILVLSSSSWASGGNGEEDEEGEGCPFSETTFVSTRSSGGL
eukprot:CAMPEP_0185780340 /NCGR_PEP_ID=MMETSP1174-20130828/98779_1 /TAXON_ID=35687 /ORGANISM="Dictyocha speculum, Strain CCMP1381" /LENGTH=64 /DNA_ID=CAMNT_0028469857 /DNA_START=40 /DNA_END=231 /DNA_ORIENTATION=-